MENLENLDLVELKKAGLQDVEGGIGFLIFGAVLGYIIGDIIFS